jgi:hypothetical protein
MSTDIYEYRWRKTPLKHNIWRTRWNASIEGKSKIWSFKCHIQKTELEGYSKMRTAKGHFAIQLLITFQMQIWKELSITNLWTDIPKGNATRPFLNTHFRYIFYTHRWWKDIAKGLFQINLVVGITEGTRVKRKLPSRGCRSCGTSSAALARHWRVRGRDGGVIYTNRYRCVYPNNDK